MGRESKRRESWQVDYESRSRSSRIVLVRRAPRPSPQAAGRARLGERRTLPEIAAEAHPPGERPQRLVVKDGTRVHVIPIARLDYVVAQDDYVALHSEGKSYLKQQPIASLEDLLDQIGRASGRERV